MGNHYLCSMKSKREEQRMLWWQRYHYGEEAKRSMKRRNAHHDYYSRRIYMITLVVEGRKPVLGNLCEPDEDHREPWVSPSMLGERILNNWTTIPSHYPEVRNLAIQLMPDHLHFILFVTKQVPYHLGKVVNGFKTGCNKISRELLGTTLWQDGYHDRILQKEGQLEAMMHYMHDNPRRLWIKRKNPDYFTVQREINVNNTTVAMAGNRFLLHYPIKAVVQCSRSINNEEDIAREVKRFMSMVRDGAVLVSASISPCEKAVMRAGFEAGAKEIVLLENGFSPMWKPGGAQFDACAKGQLLFVAPWSYHSDHKTITREQCMQLNALAREIARIEPAKR